MTSRPKRSELFLTLARTHGDFAGVFEHDGTNGYLYLCSLQGGPDFKILASVGVVGPEVEFLDGDVGLLWSQSERLVGVMFKGQLCAAFECVSGELFGGPYSAVRPPLLPDWVQNDFAG